MNGLRLMQPGHRRQRQRRSRRTSTIPNSSLLVILLIAIAALSSPAPAGPVVAPIGSWRGENDDTLTIGADHTFILQSPDSQIRAAYTMLDSAHIKIEFVTRGATNSTTYSFSVSGGALVLTNVATQKVTRFHKTDIPAPKSVKPGGK
ncbi:MAG TPA: hypothetical protein VL361_00555 [Candidatus Limnocylindrales bacterium]|nr:hypothetical protein [Candidatus Limnocylindrales bacterium]